MAATLFGTLGKLISTLTTAETVASTAAETKITGATIPANAVNIGTVIRLEAHGVMGNTSTPTFAVKLYAGTTAILAPSAATTIAMTACPWTMVCQLTVLTVGATGTALASLFFDTHKNDGTTGIEPCQIAAVDTSADTIDFTASWAFQWSVTWGTSSSSNTITVAQQAVWIY